MLSIEQPCRRAATAREVYRKWNSRNWQTEPGKHHRRDARSREVRSTPLGQRPKRRLARAARRRALGGQGTRATNQSPTNWSAAIAAALIWLRVLSSGAIAGAASASVSATGRPLGGASRRSGNSPGSEVNSGTGLVRARSLIFRLAAFSGKRCCANGPRKIVKRRLQECRIGPFCTNEVRPRSKVN